MCRRPGRTRTPYNFQGAVSVPIIVDKLAIRVAGLGDQNDINKVRDVTNNTTSLGHTQSGRVSIAAQPDDDIKAILTYQYLYADNVQNQQVIGPGTLVPATAGFLPTIPPGRQRSGGHAREPHRCERRAGRVPQPYPPHHDRGRLGYRRAQRPVAQRRLPGHGAQSAPLPESGQYPAWVWPGAAYRHALRHDDGGGAPVVGRPGFLELLGRGPISSASSTRST